MPPKEKKPKKSKKAEENEDEEELNAVDKQFYELTISDINKKLSRLRGHNVKIEERNDELESKMKQMEEDRQDVTNYLNRTLNQKINIIQELEDKLTELSKVRKNENEDCKKRMTEWENKFKTMHDHLTSEIKLLTGKLNSMEEFRAQRDELMAKFDLQEQELKEQQKKHKAIIYDMERKVILDKERMRKDVENKLLELSTEFTKSSEIRVAAHTQRLVRENIALNNDMDRVIFTQERLQRENEEMKIKHQEIVGQFDANSNEKKRLIKTCEQQVDIIEKLTNEYESLRDQNTYLREIKRGHEVARKMTRDNRKELMDELDKKRRLEQHIHTIHSDREHLKCDTIYHRQEYQRVSDIIKAVRYTVKSAIKGDTDDDVQDAAFRESQRKNLLTDLLNILNDLEKHGNKPSLETIPSIQDIYIQGDLGFIPARESAETILQKLPKLQIDPRFATPSIQSIEKFNDLTEQQSLLEIPLVDVASGSQLFISDSEESEVVSNGSETNLKKKQLERRQTLKENADDFDRKSRHLLSIDLTKSLEHRDSEVEDEKSDDGKDATDAEIDNSKTTRKSFETEIEHPKSDESNSQPDDITSK